MSDSLFSQCDDHILIHDPQIRIERAGDLLERYVETDDQDPLMQTLNKIRDLYLTDLDQVDSAAEITGLIAWLLREHKIDHRGESLSDTADRLCDLDSAQDSDQYRQLIYHLRDAIERLDDLEAFED